MIYSHLTRFYSTSHLLGFIRGWEFGLFIINILYILMKFICFDFRNMDKSNRKLSDKFSSSCTSRSTSSSSGCDRRESPLMVKYYMKATARRRSYKATKMKCNQMSRSMGTDFFEHTSSVPSVSENVTANENIDILSIFERARTCVKPAASTLSAPCTSSAKTVVRAVPSTSASGGQLQTRDKDVTLTPTASTSNAAHTSVLQHTVDPRYLNGYSSKDPRWYFYQKPEPVDPRLASIRKTVQEIQHRKKFGPPPKPPQPEPDADLLKGVVAYVDVIRNDHILTEPASKDIERLGGIVRQTFTKDVTHVIFENGSRTTYKKAQEVNVEFVGLSWLHHCGQKRRKLLPLERWARQEKMFTKEKARLAKAGQETEQSADTDSSRCSRYPEHDGCASSSRTLEHEGSCAATQVTPSKSQHKHIGKPATLKARHLMQYLYCPPVQDKYLGIGVDKSDSCGSAQASIETPRPRRKSTINISYVNKSDSESSEVSSPPNKKRKVQNREEVPVGTCYEPCTYEHFTESDGKAPTNNELSVQPQEASNNDLSVQPQGPANN
ncbi:hypothetical protein B566_EDAN002397, partial [Ephemera danica]